MSNPWYCMPLAFSPLPTYPPISHSSPWPHPLYVDASLLFRGTVAVLAMAILGHIHRLPPPEYVVTGPF